MSLHPPADGPSLWPFFSASITVRSTELKCCEYALTQGESDADSGGRISQGSKETKHPQAVLSTQLSGSPQRKAWSVTWQSISLPYPENSLQLAWRMTNLYSSRPSNWQPGLSRGCKLLLWKVSFLMDYFTRLLTRNHWNSLARGH